MCKKSILIISVAILLLFSSCSLGGENLLSKFFVDDQGKAKKTFEQILEAIQSQDKEALRSLFSENTRKEADDLDDSMDSLFDYFQGDFVSYFHDWGSPGVFDGWDDDDTGRQKWKSFESTYDVETSQQKYRFAIKECRVDTANPQNVGISSLYIILAENTDLQFAYWGDQKWTSGIVIDTEYYFD